MNFDTSKPIWLQLVSIFASEIYTGNWACGEKIPTVRELAFQYKVNPNTVQRALLHLDQVGVLQTARTTGRFVTEDKKKIQKLLREEAIYLVEEFIRNIRRFDFSNEEILEILRENLIKNSDNSNIDNIINKD